MKKNQKLYEKKGFVMSYLKDFQTQINSRDFSKFLQLWEEYCNSDVIDTEEFVELLKSLKKSDFARQFGAFIETALPLLELLDKQDQRYEVLKHLIDLQTTNSPLLADISITALKDKYNSDPHFTERLRLVGLRNKDSFQQALSNYDLLAHMQVGKFVFHPGGWGTGEVMEISPVRQQVTIEFENVSGKKSITFENAFKALIPLDETHFLVRRFANADKLEAEAKENPVDIIKLLLHDLGPLNASEIKDELCELVIPDADWAKWWQSARAKLKKDMIIEQPEKIKDPFKLRKSEISQEERLKKAFNKKTDVQELILSSYNFVKELPNTKKNQEVRNTLRDKLIEQLGNTENTPSQELQLCLLLENHFSHQVSGKECQDLIQKMANIEDVVESIEIIAVKKRALTLIRENRSDWAPIFLKLLLNIKQTILKDYILKELNHKETASQLNVELKNLLRHPESSPETFIWYFLKLLDEEANIPYSNREGLYQFFDGFLILYSHLEKRPESRDLLKKMYLILSGNRFSNVRKVLENSTIEFAKEFLLLASKCTTLTDHDLKTLRSLVEVVHPSLSTKKRKSISSDSNVFWTTEEGYLKAQEQVKKIGTTEMVENAREIEAARALGDLRENSEYKFALEKRSRLQSQLKVLSDQLGKARIITKDDILNDEVGVGSIIDIVDSNGNESTYTILGPWEADADKHILSIQSKLAESMLGCHEGDKFKFRDEEMRIQKIRSYL